MQEDYTAEIKSDNKIVSGIYEILESLVFAIAFVILIFVFIAKLSIVSGDSMNNTLENADYLIVANLFSSYEPKNGDIVVIDTNDHPEPLVKRVIATEGQQIKIRYSKDLSQEGIYEIYVNGSDTPLNESYALYDFGSYRRPLYYIAPSSNVMDEITYDAITKTYTATATVPEGCVFVMGDNRNNSLDSRSSQIGFVDADFILGKCVFRILPLQKIGTLN